MDTDTADTLTADRQECDDTCRLDCCIDDRDEADADEVWDEEWAAENVAIQTAKEAACVTVMPEGYETGYTALATARFGNGSARETVTLLAGTDRTVMVVLSVRG